MNSLHWRQVEHHAAIDRSSARNVVTAATNRDFEAELAGEIDGIHDVGDAAAAGDQRRALVDEAVMHLPCNLVPGICRLQELPAERDFKLGCSGSEGRYRHGALSQSFGQSMTSTSVGMEQTRRFQLKMNHFHLHCRGWRDCHPSSSFAPLLLPPGI